MRRLRVLLIVLTLSSVALGQFTSASLNGIVTDPSRAMVDGAKVTAINRDTNTSYVATTDKTGNYTLPSLPPGRYRVEVEKPGFKTVLQPEIVLHIQDVIAINFELPVGSVSESVTVEAGAPLVDTQSAAVSTVVDQTYVANMPLNGRSFQDLILLTPGVVTQSSQPAGNLGGTAAGNGQTGEFSVNGQRTEENYYTVDGVSANVGNGFGSGGGSQMFLGSGLSGSVAASTALGTTQSLVSVDDLQEFRVQSSSYSAEYGRNPGAQIAFETKSGNNQWHGTAYDYLRNGFFDATDWFNGFYGVKEPALRQNDFGGTLGGPLQVPHIYDGKDKTFFFFSYEGLRLSAPVPASVADVPDAALRASTPAPLQQVLNAWPVQSPGLPDDVTQGIAQFVSSWANPSSIDSTSVRFDHVVKDRLRLFFRFSDTESSADVRTASLIVPPTINTTSDYTLRSYTGGATSLLSNRLSNDFRVNYTSNRSASNWVIDAFGGSTPVNLQQMIGLGAGSAPQVVLELPGHLTYISQFPQSGAQRQWNFVDTASLSWGRHQFKFGVDYRRLTPFEIQATPSPGYVYQSVPSVQHNNADFISNQVFGPAYPLYTNFSAFAQDEWKVSSRLALSLGLRWDVNPPPGVTQGTAPYTLLGTDPSNFTFAPEGTPLWHTTWFNFAPRLGAAYVVRDRQGWETVLRGGGGLFFDTGQQVGSAGFGSSGFFGAAYGSGPFPGTLPMASIVTPPSVKNCPYPCGVGFYPHLQLPYTIEWNASVEQALGKSQALTVSYVGSHASRLLESLFEVDINTFNVFDVVANGQTSDYDSLQVQLQRRLSQGLTALGSYTWSHCLDYGSSNLLIGFQHGNCDMDIRQNFSGAISYDIPDFGKDRFINAFLHHWGIDGRITARTGFPISLGGSQHLLPNGNVDLSGLDLVPNQPIYVTQCGSPLAAGPPQIPCPGGKGINPAAFAPVPIDPNTGLATRLGTAPRNFVRGPGAWQLNLAVRREFPIYERLKLQFRAEAFNVFNHPSFGSFNTAYCATDPNSPYFQPGCRFGEATKTLANSLGTLSPLYQMGGPRSMQFALKLIF